MSNVAAIASSITLVLGAIVLLRETGYSFDLRRPSRRRALGGRRAGDLG